MCPSFPARYRAVARPQIDESKIFDAAVAEFSARTYEEASLNTIISSAGISKGSFYYRFENKYALYLYVLREGARRKWDFIRAELGPEAERLPLLEVLFAQAKAGLKFAENCPELHQLSKNFSREKGSAVYEAALQELGGTDNSGLGEAIRRAHEDGQLGADYPLAFLQRLIPFLFGSFDEIAGPVADEQGGGLLDNFALLLQFIRRGLDAKS